MSFNQIKKYSEPLYDKSRCSWIVGYIPSNTTLKDTEISFGTSADWIKNNKNTIVVDNIEDWRGYQYISEDTYFLDDNSQIYVEFVTKADSTIIPGVIVGLYDTYYKTHVGYEKSYLSRPLEVNKLYDGTYSWFSDIPKELVKTKKSDELISTEGQTSFRNAFYRSGSFETEFTTYLENKKIKMVNDFVTSISSFLIYSTSDDRTFRVTKVLKDIASEFSEYIDPHSALAGAIKNNIPARIYVGNDEIDFDTTPLNELDADSLYLTGFGTCFRYELEEVFNQKMKVSFPEASSRTHLEDQPYDMFCMPYSNDIWMDDGNTTTKYINFKETAYNIATQISKDLGGSSSSGSGIYDIQIVPYCPL